MISGHLPGDGPVMNVFQGPNETTIRLGEQRVQITLKDTQAMHRALIEAISDSTALHQAQLMRVTQNGPAGIDVDGNVRIGPWLLQVRDGSLALVYRLQDPPGGIAYAAMLQRTGAEWKVTHLDMLRLP